MDRNNYHTYLFVGLCWFIPIVLLALTIGPLQWILLWSDLHQWNSTFRTFSFLTLLGILGGLIVVLTRSTTRFLINSNYIHAPLHTGIWLFLTLSSIASLSWLIINPELFATISQAIALHIF